MRECFGRRVVEGLNECGRRLLAEPAVPRGIFRLVEHACRPDHRVDAHHLHGRFPIGVVEAGRIPSRLLKPGVVILAGVDMTERDRPRPCLPRLVRYDPRARAARRFEFGLDPQQERRPVVGLDADLVVAALRDGGAVPERIAEHHADRVAPALHERDEVDFLEVDRSVVL